MRKLLDWVLTIGAAVLIVLACEAEVAKPFKIPSSSMEPTLHCAKPGAWCEAQFNDRVIANRLAFRFGSPKRGQIVVFEAPKDACGVGGTFVKRLIGLPGDYVQEHDGRVLVNGTLLKEPYIDPAMRGDGVGAWRVPKGSYFFMGDDRAHSCDSRMWGAVPRSHLIGPVLATYWPPTRLSLH
jgi:signal peptidase I